MLRRVGKEEPDDDEADEGQEEVEVSVALILLHKQAH